MQEVEGGGTVLVAGILSLFYEGEKCPCTSSYRDMYES